MSVISFPLRLLKDLKPWGINSPTQTKDWLVAVQRTAAASLTVFVVLRYGPALKTPLSPVPVRVLTLVVGSLVVGYCLSAPATFIGLGAFMYHKVAVNLMNLKYKNMTFIVIDILGIAGVNVLVNTYQMPFLPTPNFLDKAFISIADRYCGAVYDRLFSR